MNCCDANGDCNQGRECPARTGTVLPHQARHACKVARIKSTRPAWLPGDGVPPEAGNFQIRTGLDADSQPLNHDESMALVRTLLSWLFAVVGGVGLLALAVSYSTEVYARALWAFLAGLS